MKFRFVKISFLSVLALSVFTLISCSSYDSTFDYSSLMAECPSDISVYNQEPYLVVMPTDVKAGFVFYPGALVSYQSYLPLMIKCAQGGIACFIVRMPQDFAFMNIYGATRILKLHPDISKWYIGGHSLGGAMAASYVSGHTKDFAGLVLLASFSTSDLSNSSLKVLSVYGSLDGVLNRESYEKYKNNLPTDFTEIVIEGGNHAQFADYGKQSGDNDATITASQQQTLTANAIIELVNR